MCYSWEEGYDYAQGYAVGEEDTWECEGVNILYIYCYNCTKESEDGEWGRKMHIFVHGLSIGLNVEEVFVYSAVCGLCVCQFNGISSCGSG